MTMVIKPRYEICSVSFTVKYMKWNMVPLKKAYGNVREKYAVFRFKNPVITSQISDKCLSRYLIVCHEYLHFKMHANVWLEYLEWFFHQKPIFVSQKVLMKRHYL